MYNHVAPPNWAGFDCGQWSAIPDAPGEHAIVSARSSHTGGVNSARATVRLASLPRVSIPTYGERWDRVTVAR